MKSMPRSSQRAVAASAVSHAVLAFVAVGGISIASPSLLREAHAVVAAQDAPPAPPLSVASARRVAAEIGLDAAALAAVGMNAEGCAALVQRLVDAPVGLEGLEQLKTSLAVAADQLEQARQAAQDGSADAAAGIPQLEAAVENATNGVAAIRSVLRGIALDGLDPAMTTTLDMIDSARKRRVPTEFMVISRTDAEWELLERALRQESRGLRTGEPLDPQYSGVLSAARAHPAVSSAAASIAALLPTLEAALVAE